MSTYEAETVRSRTELALVEFQATMIGCTYGCPTRSEMSANLTHAEVSARMVTIAVRKTIPQIWGTKQARARWSTRREK